MKTKTEKIQMSTLSECMKRLSELGFKENFLIEDAGTLVANGKKYTPAEVKIVDFYRFEGESDPADSSILYAIETIDGKKGMITNAYGQYSDTKINSFIEEIDEISKKPHTQNEKQN